MAIFILQLIISVHFSPKGLTRKLIKSKNFFRRKYITLKINALLKLVAEFIFSNVIYLILLNLYTIAINVNIINYLILFLFLRISLSSKITTFLMTMLFLANQLSIGFRYICYLLFLQFDKVDQFA